VKGEAVPTEIGQRRFLIVFALFAIFGLALATPARSAPGSLDKAFSGDGKVRVRTHYIDEAHDMALDTNGRIVLVGITWIRADGLPTIEVMRLTPTGALDGSFSRNGRRTLRFGRGGNVADAVAIQPDGRIVIVGHRYAWARNGAALMGIARLLPGGRLDRSFSGDGRREVDLPYSREDAGESLAVQEDGKIVIGGEADDRGALVRLRPSGRLDYSFGRRGHVLTEEDGSRFTSLALQPNGRILGATDRLVRYLPEGSPDASFGESGVAIDPAGPRTWGCLDIALQKNGKIVCSSAFINDDPLSQSGDAAVLRWRQDGVPDSGFGTDGSSSPESSRHPARSKGGVRKRRFPSSCSRMARSSRPVGRTRSRLVLTMVIRFSSSVIWHPVNGIRHSAKAASCEHSSPAGSTAPARSRCEAMEGSLSAALCSTQTWPSRVTCPEPGCLVPRTERDPWERGHVGTLQRSPTEKLR
jgi:uncharacterized delta-60 repeat protein